MDTTKVPTGSIVVGIDGSGASDQALGWAIDQARLEHRPLTLAYGVAPNTVWLDQGGVDRSWVLESMRSDGATLLEAARDTVEKKAPELVVHLVLRMADPRVTLLDLSPEAAMIVLGSRGRGPVRSLLLGSVGLAVAQHASCPVVVLRPRKVGMVHQGILVGVDGTDSSRATLEVAYRLASQRSLPLTVLHCFWDAGQTGGAADTEGVAAGERDTEAQRLVLSEAVSGMGEKFPDVKVRLRLARGLPDNCLVESSTKMDMVVVGSHPRSAVEGLVFGSVSRGVLEHAHCIVTVVPEPAHRG